MPHLPLLNSREDSCAFIHFNVNFEKIWLKIANVFCNQKAKAKKLIFKPDLKGKPWILGF